MLQFGTCHSRPRSSPLVPLRWMRYLRTAGGHYIILHFMLCHPPRTYKLNITTARQSKRPQCNLATKHYSYTSPVQIFKMFKTTSSAVRSVLQHTYNTPLLGPGHPAPLSTESASSAAARITDAFTKLQSTPSDGSGMKLPSLTWGPSEQTRAGQSVWLAKHSFASSAVRKSQVSGTDGSKQETRDATNRETAAWDDQPCTKSWDGLTSWPHLW
jgi:hypothetical protein